MPSITQLEMSVEEEEEELKFTYVVSQEQDKPTITLSSSDFNSPVEEPLLEKNPSRFVMFPVQYDALWNKYKLQLAIFDTAEHVLEKVDTKKELQHWNALSKEEQEFLKHALYSFVATYSIRNDLRIVELINAVQVPEARAFLSIQLSKESINAEMFSSLLECYTSSSAESEPKYIDWYSKHITLAEKFIAQVAMKGIFFTVLRCVIYWIKEERLPGLSKSNALITQDVLIQAEFACLLYSMLVNKKLQEKQIESIVREAVDLEKSVIPQQIKGLEAKELAQYIEYVADTWMEKLRCNKIFKAQNPFQQWMPPISSSEMPRIVTRKTVQPSNGVFTLDAEF